MMTKKNYEAAARIVQNILPGGIVHSHPTAAGREKRAAVLEAKAVCTAFVLLFRDDNPQFDQERFMKACGVEL